MESRDTIMLGLVVLQRQTRELDALRKRFGEESSQAEALTEAVAALEKTMEQLIYLHRESVKRVAVTN
jgi:hypothetical protein